MSQLPAQSCTEGVWQYCNYGYDKTIYSSFDQCIQIKTKEDCGIFSPHNNIFIFSSIIIAVILIFIIRKIFRKKPVISNRI